MPSRADAIKKFLEYSTHIDLADQYSLNMECQVNVAQDGGERIEGEFKGKKWQGWTDSVTTWKSFRIPWKANTDPEYIDTEIKFDLVDHAEAIGMTGWDWVNRCSKWVAYDFDAIIGHSDKHKAKLTNQELEDVKNSAYDIEWVTIRKSTSGQGIHLYVYLDNIETANHNEHAALARSILGKMSALSGFDFDSRVDACGSNMWIWHRKMLNTSGLELIKSGSILKDISPNWKDHIKVIKGSRRKNLPQNIEARGNSSIFEDLTSQRHIVTLDEEHKKLINYLKDNDVLWWWDQDHHMLVTHTMHLENAFNDLNLKGYFKTNSTAGNTNEQNCFAFPLRRGAWGVRRYTPGVQEHDTWDQDGSGWTRCYLNREPDIGTASRAYGGLEDQKGGFVFREAELAVKAAALLGVVLTIPVALRSRETTLKNHKDGRLIIEIDRNANDPAIDMKGWLAKGSKPWSRIYNTQIQTPIEPDSGNYDDMVRHLITETNEDYGWSIKSDNRWRFEPLVHIKAALASLGLSGKEITSILGSSIFKAWKVVNKPFQPEYPGDREWNRNAAQYRFSPSKDENDLHYPTWKMILEHVGLGLDDSVKSNGWCIANSILSGADYYKCWIASLFQSPNEPLPYLFFYGPQNSGKSMFHEALNLLLTKGYKRADAALISQAGFNAELEGAIICVIEETDLRHNKTAYNRIKDWVTSSDLMIHAKGRTPYSVVNTSHFIHASNDYQACPIFPGDTRITMCHVETLDPLNLIPKKHLIPKLEKEAPDFLAEILKLEIPPSNDRLNVPVIGTEDKVIAQQLNLTPLEEFLQEKCVHKFGLMIKFSDFYDRFTEFIDANDVSKWSKKRVGKQLPPKYPKGRLRKTGHFYIGNISWIGSEEEENKPKLILKDNYLDYHD